jgi:thiamine biosynthesis protein ThiI
VVLRPLITFDKVETTALARRIDTFETSILPFDDCCSLFVPSHPATRARLQDAERAEAKLDMTAEVAAVAAAAECISVVAPSVTYTG